MAKLMLVEDNQAVRESLSLALEKDFEVSQAQSGEEALARVDAEKPDLMLLDHRLEGLSGTQVMERLADREQRTQVVLYSAVLDMTLARQAMKLGASDCIPKMSTLELLREKLRKAASSLPPRRGPQEPFYLRVARLLSQTAECQTPDNESLDARVLVFVRGLLQEALNCCDGDATRAAERLGLEDEEFRQLKQRLHREENYAVSATAAC
jgi:DNA-binding NtrC family response regulator